MSGHASIAEFTNPPVIEVVLSVAFDALPELSVPKLVLAWDRMFRATFPESEEHAPYAPPIERFGPQRYGPGLQLQIGEEFPVPRFWFLDKEGTNLLQLQNNWFARNWRKQDDSGTYIRYARLREAFSKDFGSFADYITAEGLGEIVPVQCELTYIDHIVPNQYWTNHGDMARVFTLFDVSLNDVLSSEPDDLKLGMSYIIGDAEAPLGRLYINIQPAIRKSDGTPIFVVNTTARGAPRGTGLDGVLAFLDVGHEWAVRGFIDVTSTDMHMAWGKKDA